MIQSAVSVALFLFVVSLDAQKRPLPQCKCALARELHRIAQNMNKERANAGSKSEASSNERQKCKFPNFSASLTANKCRLSAAIVGLITQARDEQKVLASAVALDY